MGRVYLLHSQTHDPRRVRMLWLQTGSGPIKGRGLETWRRQGRQLQSYLDAG